MKKRLLIGLVLALLVFALLGCAPAEEPAEPANDEADEPEVENDVDDPAVSLIEARCSDCHDLGRVYQERETEEWPAIVESMVDRAPGLLDDEEFNLVVEYLQENYGVD